MLQHLWYLCLQGDNGLVPLLEKAHLVLNPKNKFSPTKSFSKSLSAKKCPNISYNLVSPYSEGDVSLLPLKNNEISLPSFEARQPFIQKHF